MLSLLSLTESFRLFQKYWVSMKEVLLVIISLAGIIALIFLTYYASRWLSKRVYRTTSRSLEIVERLGVTNDKSLIIARAGGKLLLLGVTAQHIEKLCDLDDEDIVLPPVTTEGGGGSFLDNLKKATKLQLKNSFGAKEREQNDDTNPPAQQ